MTDRRYIARTCDPGDLVRAGMGEPGTYVDRDVWARDPDHAVAAAAVRAAKAGQVVLSVAEVAR